MHKDGEGSGNSMFELPPQDEEAQGEEK